MKFIYYKIKIKFIFLIFKDLKNLSFKRDNQIKFSVCK